MKSYVRRAAGALAVRGGVALAAAIGCLLKRGTRDVVRLGTRYGGWFVCSSLLGPGSTAVCVGAGEDISFDIELQALKKCRVFIMDPTPRAIDHVRRVLSAATHPNAGNVEINSTVYPLAGLDLTRVQFEPVALWNRDGTLTFHPPHDPTHVSHSAVNLQGTENVISVPCETLRSTIARLELRAIDLLKIDIEGAEIEVLEDLLTHGPLPRQLLVEFDSLVSANAGLMCRGVRCLLRLSKAGYRLVARERVNFSFALDDDHAGTSSV